MKASSKVLLTIILFFFVFGYCSIGFCEKAKSELSRQGTPPQKTLPQSIPSLPQGQQMQGEQISLFPDLIVSEIATDSSNNIIVKLKNIGRAGLNDTDYSRMDAGRPLIAVVELIIDGVRITEHLSTIDLNKALKQPGGEVVWNTGKNVWRNIQDTRTEVVVNVDAGNVIKEANENNNSLKKLFQRSAAFTGDRIDLQIIDIKNYPYPSDTLFYAEIKNVGNKEFRGDIRFDAWVKDKYGRWSQLLPNTIHHFYDSTGKLVADILLQDMKCLNILLQPGETMSSTELNPTPPGKCNYNYFLSITPSIPYEGVDIKVILKTSNPGENKSNNEFIKHIMPNR